MDIKVLNIKRLKPLSQKRSSDYSNYEVTGIDKENNELKGKISDVLEDLRRINKGKTIMPSGIFKCASNYYPKYFGYSWEFINYEDKNRFDIFKSLEARDKMLNLNNDNKREIVAYSLSGEPIEGFNNIFEAVLWLKEKHKKNIDYKSILFVAKNYMNPKKSQTAKGFRWRFLDDVLENNERNINSYGG